MTTLIKIYKTSGVISDAFIPTIKGKEIIDNKVTEFKMTYSGESVADVLDYLNTNDIEITDRDLFESEEDRETFKFVQDAKAFITIK